MFILATWSKPSDPVWPRGTLPPFPVQLVQPKPGPQRAGTKLWIQEKLQASLQLPSPQLPSPPPLSGTGLGGEEL